MLKNNGDIDEPRLWNGWEEPLELSSEGGQKHETFLVLKILLQLLRHDWAPVQKAYDWLFHSNWFDQ